MRREEQFIPGRELEQRQRFVQKSQLHLILQPISWSKLQNACIAGQSYIILARQISRSDTVPENSPNAVK